MKITVNEEEVPQDLIQRFLAHEKALHPEQEANRMEENAIQALIRNILIRQSANIEISDVPEESVENEFRNFRAQFKSEPEFQQLLIRSGSNEAALKDEMRGTVKIRTFLNRVAKDVPVPPEHLIKEYYNRNPGLSVKPVEVHAAHILKKPDQDNPAKTYNIMLKLRKELLAGADFSELADKNSDCNDSKGGDLGFFSPGQMVEEFETILFSMNIGEISPVFRTSFGYHIAKVLEIRPVKKLTFEECREKILEDMVRKLQDQKIGEWIEEKKKKSKIIIER